jgi:predicted permease
VLFGVPINNFVLIALCLACGLWLRLSRRVDDTSGAGLNAYLVNIAMPAVAFSELHGTSWTTMLGWPAGMAWVLFGFGVAYFYLCARLFRWSPETRGVLILTAALANTSFVGFPLLEAFYGPEAIATGVIVDQLGSFSVLATAGLLVAASSSGTSVSPREILARVIVYPPLLAVFAAFALESVEIPAVLMTALARLAETLIPLALVSVGMQLRLRETSDHRVLLPLASGLLFKLIIGPALVAIPILYLSGARGFEIQVTMLESAMPPMVMGGILAMQHGLRPSLAGLMILVGIPLSFFTVPIWWWLLRGFA